MNAFNRINAMVRQPAPRREKPTPDPTCSGPAVRARYKGTDRRVSGHTCSRPTARRIVLLWPVRLSIRWCGYGFIWNAPA
ncbi:hypothetical protein IFM12276_25730 [Nocardia sputorum]|uniref:Uncharacterized protein n=1 Tax=Nocardia sputorum TaxID=2984338 RepID=A0ABN6U307_9NOCA|nr:hypothetical protein IFM12276_25730 [Nocardia sputorum]